MNKILQQPFEPSDLVLFSPTPEELEDLSNQPELTVRARFLNKKHNGRTECSTKVKHIISGAIQKELASVSKQIFEQESKPEIEKLRQDVDFLLRERDKVHRALWGSKIYTALRDSDQLDLFEVIQTTVGSEILGRIRSDFGRDLERKLFQEEQERRKLERDRKAEES